MPDFDPFQVAVAPNKIDAVQQQATVRYRGGDAEERRQFIRIWGFLLRRTARELDIDDTAFEPYDFLGLAWAILLKASKTRGLKPDLYQGIHKFYTVLSKAAAEKAAADDAAATVPSGTPAAEAKDVRHDGPPQG